MFASDGKELKLTVPGGSLKLHFYVCLLLGKVFSLPTTRYCVLVFSYIVQRVNVFII